MEILNGLSDEDDLFAYYVQQTFYGGYGMSPTSVDPGAVLNSAEYSIYNTLSAKIKNIANGSATSTEFSFSAPSGLTCAGGSLSGADIDRIISVMLVNHPFEMYWYDKTSTGGAAFSYEYNSTNVVISFTFKFSVANEFRGSQYATNASKCSAAASAAANARNVINTYASYSDYEKLKAYKNWILNAVDYNHSAANNSSTPYGNPWQLIWVFDNDPSTKVVCEGYSKAFQYLCDMSSFTGTVECYSVSGYMDTPSARHMWNVVRVGDKNYLVDVTNCDGGNPTEGLFLVGGTPVSGGYKISWVGTSHTTNYIYNSDQTALYGSRLNLASANFDPGSSTSGSPGSRPTLPNTAVTDRNDAHWAIFLSLTVFTLAFYGLKRKYDYEE